VLLRTKTNRLKLNHNMAERIKLPQHLKYGFHIRSPRWKPGSRLARLPESYYKYTLELEKPKQRIHDAPPKTDFLDMVKNKEYGTM
jgi:hypothetical protein